ncbi:hypothetical protein GCM10028867_30320 [Nocardioides pacificus]
MVGNTTRRYRWEYPAVAPSVEGMTPETTPATPATGRSARLAYDDFESPDELYGACRAARDNLHVGPRLEQAARAAVAPAPSLHYADFPREVAKRDIRISDATARLAGALHLHLD